MCLFFFEVMEGGCIVQSGTYEELLTSGTTFKQLLNAHRDAITVLDTLHENHGESSKVETVNMVKPNGGDFTDKNTEGEIHETTFQGGQLTQEERREMGEAGLNLLLDYIFISKGLLLSCLTIITIIGFIACLAGSSYWLALAIQIPNITTGVMVGVYTGLSFLGSVFIYLRSYCAAHLGLKASKAFFSGFNDAIFNAPMSFFDSTPIGRILTRVRFILTVSLRKPMSNIPFTI